MHRVASVTLDAAHHRCDRLAELLPKMQSAVSGFHRNHRGRKFAAGHGVEHFIRVPEFVHGANGWHPHFHELWLLSAPADRDALRAAAFRVWDQEASAAGLKTSEEHGIHVSVVGEDGRDPRSAAGYLVKGFFLPNPQTLSRPVMEKGHEPFRLLYDSMRGDRGAEHLFREYAAVTLGLQRMVTSKKLHRAMPGMATAPPVEAQAGVSVSLAEGDWKVIQRAGAQAELKAVARKAHERGEEGIVTAYLRGLGCPSYQPGSAVVEKSPAAAPPVIKPEKFMPAALLAGSQGGGYYTEIPAYPKPGSRRKPHPDDLVAPAELLRMLFEPAEAAGLAA